MYFSKIKLFSIATLLIAFALPLLGPVKAQEATPEKDDSMTLQQLLEQVRAGRLNDNAEFQKRETEFRTNRNRQAALLKKVRADIAREEARSER
ncbi:MAG: hypothetical protein ACR2PV_00015, partial [Gammaproteobacteria bacterium]